MKKSAPKRYPSLFCLDRTTDIILYLLQRELKTAKLSQKCRELGMESNFFYCDLGLLIISLMELPYRSEKFMGWYDKKLDSWSKKVVLQDVNSTAQLALEFYQYIRSKASTKNIS